MNSTNSHKEAFLPDVPAFQRGLDRVHWFVAGSALAFGITISLVKVTPLLVCLSSLIGVFALLLNLVAVRRNNQLYSVLGTIVAILGITNLYHWVGMSPISGSFAALGVGFLVPYSLLWIGRRWVTTFCRLEEKAAPNS